MHVQKITYFFGSARKRLRRQGSQCPSCGSRTSSLVATKYWVTALRRCGSCHLLFRTPTTTDVENRTFYQTRYKQGFTTNLPDPEELARLKATGFSGTEKDYSRFVTVLKALGVTSGARVFDFGCSWGYGSWQLMQNGYHVECYEISDPRRRYARQKLGCTVHSDLDDVEPGFDVFFSSHVLEHVASPRNVIEFATSVLRPGGLFIAFTPNGSMAHRAQQPERWQMLWGLVHPNFLDEQYYRRCFGSFPYLLDSEPYCLEDVRAWRVAESEQWMLDMTGPELMCVARIARQL